MNSKEILYSKGSNDECYTPDYAVLPLLPYLPKDSVVWCPFDREDSAFVRLIGKTHKVIYSHLDTGEDFYSYEPEKWDVLISNPPYTNKRLIFERALSFNRPFALLMSNTWLNYAAPAKLFKDRDLQLLMFDKRIKYTNNGKIENKITFSSSYYCWNFLPRQIIMCELCIVQ